MLDFLDRLREKPEAYRMRIAVVAAAVITACIVGVWFLTFDLGNAEQKVKSNENNPSPLATFRDTFSQFADESTLQFNAMRSLFEEWKQNEK
ncbi:MAG TPA: hypothetical protein VGA06_02395 [Candidatus Paceibacterota bacterium]|jgi:hypothetical protein